MNISENTINKPSTLFAYLCHTAAKSEWETAKNTAEELANLGAQGTWLELAYDLADGLKSIYQASEKVFSLEQALTKEQTQVINKAQTWVSDKLGLEIPSLVIEIVPDDTPVHAITGISGFGFIMISKKTIEDQSLLVHEITHCTLMSRALFLDEGLATLLEYEVKGVGLDVDVEQTYWNRPSMAAMIETDWTYDPYFSHVVPVETNFAAPIKGDNKVHRLSAYLVALFVESKGMSYVMANWNKLKPQLKDGRTYNVIKEIFDVDIWELDANFISKTKDEALLLTEQESLLYIATKALTNGERNLIVPYLKTLRIKAFESNENLVALVKTLILLGVNGDDEAEKKFYRTEALVAMNWAIEKGCNQRDLRLFEVYKYVFKLKSAGHAINLRKIGTQTSIAFEKLINDYPEDPEVIITTARAQLKTYYDMLPAATWREKLIQISKEESIFTNAANKLLNEEKYAL
ncbi:hypothetical protein [Aquimarina agarivorans]|uniref:hypothetical protein n=1 Tax=Aquimarina agarivorans TaxID=980584 RepID=UPI000248F308|nr:hypothetical protein [Aquimarina agarivorans]